MNKIRKTKLIALVALIIAICGMALGFAAFSTTLTISSQATVTPDSSDFNLKIYGFVGSSEEEIFNPNNYTSETTATMISQINDSVKFENKSVSIDNSTMSIDIGQVTITTPSDLSGIYIKVVNTGNYDAYFDTSQIENGIIGSCIAHSGTSETLMYDACPYIQFGIRTMMLEETLLAQGKYNQNQISQADYLEVRNNDCFAKKNGICKLEKGASLILNPGIRYYDYNSPLVDGSFSVTFAPLILNFTSNTTNSINE